MSRNAVASLRVRLLSIEWVDDLAERTARLQLTREFVRRASAWAALPGEPVERWPFFDAAARVDPTTRAPQDIVDEVDAAVPGYQWHVRRACEAALHVAALVDNAAKGIPRGLLEPFAPLVRSFELGGGFVRDGSGMFEIGGSAVRFGDSGSYAGKSPSPDLPGFPDLAGEWA